MTIVEKLVVAVIALALGSALIVVPAIAYLTADDITFTVTEKERIVKSNSSKYLIFTEQEVFQNTDTIWYWKWNSSDVYGQLSPGETYEAKVYGFRIPFLSWYRNIVSVNNVSD